MSFSFNAVGSRDEVVEQLGHVKEGTHGTGSLGPELAELLAKHISQDDVALDGSYHVGYAIEASGHNGGSSPTSLSITVKPLYVQWPRKEAADPAED